jgi:hypothetical protein
MTYWLTEMPASAASDLSLRHKSSGTLWILRDWFMLLNSAGLPTGPRYHARGSAYRGDGAAKVNPYE